MSLMDAALEKAGLTAAAVPGEQLMVVVSEGDRARVALFEGPDWQEMRVADGFVGRNGVSPLAQEGAGMTPFGLYSVDEMFYMHERPDTALPGFQITQESYWVDDPASRFYNQHCEGEREKDWSSAEHMAAYPFQYEFGFAIGYNRRPVVPGKGSAFFFHVNDRSTAGCVAVAREEVLAFLKLLKPEKKPYILMV